ncbi:MAG: hydantoinase/oxoprolinase family protein [Pirellulaceae bacterium]|nr:hydantoinase/oxoprolinase family protein [Pirellulaceae bacterium]
MKHWIGLDIGGANLKIADAKSFAKQARFPMWKNPDRLAHELSQLLQGVTDFDAVALTMTGEMADCFATREEGVCRILEQVTRIVPSTCIRVYTVDGNWLSVPQAARDPWQVAASNWKALATYAARWSDGEPTLLIDVGSTTTDLLAICDKKVLSKSKSDRDRLESGELVYTGVERSSVVGIVHELSVHGRPCPVVNENFATIGDVNLILGNVPEESEDRETADGQPKTRTCAAYRLARIVGEDGTTLGPQDIEQLAETIYDAQIALISKAVLNVASQFKRKSCEHVLLSGHGDFLIDDILDHLKWKTQRTRLADRLGPIVSRCAPAHAIAVLASEQLHVPA